MNVFDFDEERRTHFEISMTFYNTGAVFYRGSEKNLEIMLLNFLLRDAF